MSLTLIFHIYRAYESLPSFKITFDSMNDESAYVLSSSLPFILTPAFSVVFFILFFTAFNVVDKKKTGTH